MLSTCCEDVVMELVSISMSNHLEMIEGAQKVVSATVILYQNLGFETVLLSQRSRGSICLEYNYIDSVKVRYRKSFHLMHTATSLRCICKPFHGNKDQNGLNTEI